jgi:hypothetical protein
MQCSTLESTLELDEDRAVLQSCAITRQYSLIVGKQCYLHNSENQTNSVAPSTISVVVGLMDSELLPPNGSSDKLMDRMG